MVVWDRVMPRSAIIWTRSRKLSLNVMYHLTHRMMISWSKCRPLNRSCAEVGSVIPAVIAGYRAFQQFAPERCGRSVFPLRRIHLHKSLEHWINLVRHLEWRKMSGTDCLAGNQVRTYLSKTIHVAYWSSCPDINNRHTARLDCCSCIIFRHMV